MEIPDVYWKAVLYVFTEAFPDDQRVWERVDLEKWSIDLEALLGDGTFSGGEKAMLEAAASLYNDEHMINLGDMAARLSSHYWNILTRALRIFRTGMGFHEGA